MVTVCMATDIEKYDDMFNRFDTIPAYDTTDGGTDRHGIFRQYRPVRCAVHTHRA